MIRRLVPRSSSRYIFRRIAFRRLWFSNDSRKSGPEQKLFGQPTASTRPEVISKGQVTPGISLKEYEDRRCNLAVRMPVGACAILVSSQIQYRSSSVFYEFHQNSNFFYMTGFNEPNSVAVIERVSNDDMVFYLFVPPKDAKVEMWEGSRTGVRAAAEMFGAHHAGDSDHLNHHLAPIIKRATQVFYDRPKPSTKPFDTFIRGDKTCSPLSSSLEGLLQSTATSRLSPIIQELRSIKSPSEIKLMKRAGEISGDAFNSAYGHRFTRESDLAAFLDYKFRIGGCEKSAYVPVVAGAQNGLCIHYVRNDDIFPDSSTVLVDAGGQFGGYCADISRTWPVNGKFTEPQRDLYQAVLNVNKACIKMTSTNVSLHDIHIFSEEALVQELKNIGFSFPTSSIFTTTNDQSSLKKLSNSQQKLISCIYPHYIGHYLGLDVHDTSSVSRVSNLKTNQVITIEPGIYIPFDNFDFPKHFRGLAVRVEDDVVVPNNLNEDPLILSEPAAKEICDIESLASEQRTL